MVRTDNFKTFYRHDKNGNGNYMRNTKNTNYFNTLHQHNQQLMNASLSPRTSGFNKSMKSRPTPPGLHPPPPPPSASLLRRNMVIQSLLDNRNISTLELKIYLKL